jgi:hypothetical protein
MSALDHLDSIDSKLAEMRHKFEEEQKALRDQLFVAQAEARLAKEQLERAVEARASAERVTAKLLTQFGTVAMIFEEAKTMAEEINKQEPPLIDTNKLADHITDDEAVIKAKALLPTMTGLGS